MISAATPKRRREVAKEENKDIKPRKPTRNVSKANEEEDEVKLVLKGCLDVIMST